MSLTTLRIRRRTVLSAIAVASVMGGFAATAPAALADGVSITLDTSAPEQGLPVDVTFSGSANAIDSDGDGPFLYAIDRPADGTGCQSSFGADQNLEEDNSDILEDGTELDAGQPFSIEDEIDPDLGPYIVCAWIETDGYDGSVADGGDTVTNSEITSGPISTSFTAAGPQVGPIKVTVPARITTGQTYNIKYATQTDQDLDLASVVIPASAGPCADSYEDETSGNDIFDGPIDTTGTDSNVGQDSETKAGNYLVCSWIEGPDDTQVDATQSTKITVVAPGSTTSTSTSGSSTNSGSTGSGRSASAGAKASGSGSSSSAKGSTAGPGSSSSSSASGTSSASSSGVCTVPRLTGMSLKAARQRLLASGCAAGVVRYTDTRKVKPGHVARLGAAPGTELRHASPITIVLARI